MEIYVLVLSLLLADFSQEHTGIRGFTNESECKKFIPEYQSLIGKFNDPGNVIQSSLTCIKIQENSNER